MADLIAAELRQDVEEIIDDQPIYAVNYVLISDNNGLGPASWGPYYSWVGRYDEAGRSVRSALEGAYGMASPQMFTLLLPYQAGVNPPRTHNLMYLLHKNGSVAGKFTVEFVKAFTDSVGDVWKYDVLLQEIQ